ncbi:hypothetical protein H2200_004922 [Cladophialophora chaetospira]|uniref:C2H2-type domain-containing protein n=1 Tax=Cladophialophora chaetospira TaxID=386627 RepID=A0AA38XE08_9EURO|nr:hypothetical protein H2200_004922 [Cladophialophora chaetospira]
MSAPSGISISLPTAAYHHEDYDSNSSYYTPRTLASHPGFLPAYTVHDYPQGGVYAISSTSTSERGRSGSGASTVSGAYSLESPNTTPTSPHLLNGAGSQYQTSFGNSTILAEPYAPLSQPQASPRENKHEVVAAQRTNSSDSADSTITDDRVFCRHEKCLDENGKPRKFFSRKADVTRHIKSQHDVKYQDCPRARCERKGNQGFTRRDHLTEHLRGFHMEDHPKRKKRGGKDDNKKTVASAEDVAPADAGMPASRARASEFHATANQVFKQEVHTSPEQELEDEFSPAEEEPPVKKRASPKAKGKTQVARHHPYARRPSKSQARAASAEDNRQEKSPHASVSPQFESSRMMEHSTVYRGHQAIDEPYTTEHMMPTSYTTHQGMDPFYIPSFGQPYHGIPAQDSPPYHDGHPHDFHFQSLHN